MLFVNISLIRSYFVLKHDDGFRQTGFAKSLLGAVTYCTLFSSAYAAPDAGALLNQQERSQVAPAAPSTLHAPQITTPNIPFAGDGIVNQINHDIAVLTAS